jgi:hypothetical protein
MNTDKHGFYKINLCANALWVADFCHPERVCQRSSVSRKIRCRIYEMQISRQLTEIANGFERGFKMLRNRARNVIIATGLHC